jgi:hypothetical protein
LSVTIFIHRRWCATFESAHAGGAEGFGLDKPNWLLAAPASYAEALAPNVLEERALIGLVDVPEAEIVFVDAHLSAPLPSRKTVCETVSATAG